jgi:hypothetical protein
MKGLVSIFDIRPHRTQVLSYYNTAMTEVDPENRTGC